MESTIQKLRGENDPADPENPEIGDLTAFQIAYDVPMADHTSFRAGGHAAAMVHVGTNLELKTTLRMLSDAGLPHLMIGNGSNMLFRDSGYDGVVIKMENFAGVVQKPQQAFPGMSMEESQRADVVGVECGISLATLAKILQRDGLTGFEFASGIPGTLGGGLFMNAGAYGGELKDVVRGVLAISPDGREERVFTNEEMQFGYRHSVLSDNGYIALFASLQLAQGDPAAIALTMRELNQKRNSKQPVQYPSAGSTFKRPEGHFAGKLIEDAGLKGFSVGGAAVSEKQDNSQDQGDDDLHGEAVSESLFGFRRVIFTHKDAGSGSASVSDKSSKGRYDHNKRHTDTYTGKGKSTLSGNMTNIDTIDDIVEHIDELCSNCGKCKLQKQLSDRLGS